MNEQVARSYAAHCRTQIGVILRSFRLAKETPSDWTPETLVRMREILGLARRQLTVTYARHPGIRPIRARQLDLFKGAGR